MNSADAALRLKEIKHKLTYKDIEPRMKEALWKYKHCSQKKPSGQIKKETEALRKYWGCYPLHYFRYGLYRTDKNLPMETLLDYIPEFFFYRLFLSYYDDDKYSIILNDKNIMEELFRAVNIAQPDTLAKIINGGLYDREQQPLYFEDLQEKLAAKGYKRIFLKPVDGQGGYGIKVFHLNHENRYMCGGHDLWDTISEIQKNKRDFILQKGIIQHPELAAIYPNSVNTFRIATENIGGEVRIVCSVLRMGKDGREVDNACQDGIVLGIDIDGGKCRDYAITERGAVFFSHPDTRFGFKGHTFTHWDEIKTFAIESARKLPQFTYLGWDIALTSEGPAAIETNMGFGLDLYQMSLGGLRDNFRITEPEKYWKCRRDAIG